MFKRRSPQVSVLGALAIMAAGWVLAGLALIGQRQAEAQQRRVDRAPVCEPSQVFSGATCRATVDGTLTALSVKRADVDAGGRHLTMVVSLHQVNGVAPAAPVQVTVYKGAPIRIDGDHVHVNAANSPANRVYNARNIVRGLAFGGTALGGMNLIILLAAPAAKRQPTAG